MMILFPEKCRKSALLLAKTKVAPELKLTGRACLVRHVLALPILILQHVDDEAFRSRNDTPVFVCGLVTEISGLESVRESAFKRIFFTLVAVCTFQIFRVCGTPSSRQNGEHHGEDQRVRSSVLNV